MNTQQHTLPSMVRRAPEGCNIVDNVSNMPRTACMRVASMFAQYDRVRANVVFREWQRHCLICCAIPLLVASGPHWMRRRPAVSWSASVLLAHDCCLAVTALARQCVLSPHDEASNRPRWRPRLHGGPLQHGLGSELPRSRYQCGRNLLM